MPATYSNDAAGQRCAAPPVLIVGMYRSGTTMLAQMLEQLGLYMGRNLGHGFDEPLFFVNLNDWILQACGGRWDDPVHLEALQSYPDLRSIMADYLRVNLCSPRSVSYFGWQNYREFRRHGSLAAPWGWKDPRTTFTLPMWLELFPDARIIHICRNGVDVARSVNKKWGPKPRVINEVGRLYARRRPLYYVRPMRTGFSFTLRAGNLEDCFALWEEYVSEAEHWVRRLGDRAVTVRYEEFLENPAPALSMLNRFCGLGAAKSEIEQTASKVRPERGYAYRQDRELAAFAETVSDRLAVHGYGAIHAITHRIEHFDCALAACG